MKLSQAFFIRVFWFGLGGVLSLAVNAGLFRLFHEVFGWNRFAAYALSLAILNVLLFLWNYAIGFKTDRHWGDSAWRQGVCLAAANALNYALVMILQGIFPRWPEAVIAAVQISIGFLKFGLYHYWVFPQAKPGGIEEKQAATL